MGKCGEMIRGHFLLKKIVEGDYYLFGGSQGGLLKVPSPGGLTKASHIQVNWDVEFDETLIVAGEGSLIDATVNWDDPDDSDEESRWDLRDVHSVLFHMNDWKVACWSRMETVLFNPKIKGKDKLQEYNSQYPYTDKAGPHYDAWMETYKKGRILIECGSAPGTEPENLAAPRENKLCVCPCCRTRGNIDDDRDRLFCPYCQKRQTNIMVLGDDDEVADVECEHCGRLFKAEVIIRYQSWRYTPWDADVKKEK